MIPRTRRSPSRSSSRAIVTAGCVNRRISRKAWRPSTPNALRSSRGYSRRRIGVRHTHNIPGGRDYPAARSPGYRVAKIKKRGAFEMTMTGMPLVDAQAPGGNRQMINAIIASVLGWSLDLFDLFILLVAPVIGALFFPSTHATLSLAAVYASFAVTLLMRPIGSAVFGHYADVHGRKGAMMIAIVGVGVSTAV